MTRLRKNVLLAEAAGWKRGFVPKTDDLGPIGLLRDTIWRHKVHGVTYTLPDYFSDLNAVHELEEQLSKKGRSVFTSILFQIAWQRGCTRLWILAHAEARYRAEAVGRAIKLW